MKTQLEKSKERKRINLYRLTLYRKGLTCLGHPRINKCKAPAWVKPEPEPPLTPQERAWREFRATINTEAAWISP